ncbi:MAG: TetR/AcrR family transcriptional regulator [Anaerolineales bacterium]|nr:TetR/AcrR family transcriptional regulator [Anaerolineales bacterium]
MQIAKQPEIMGPGRPRDPQVDRAVLAAALELLAEEGYTRLTMEGVAARAGVGKTSLYRRWNTKDALIIDALAKPAVQPAFAPVGELREDMSAYLRALVGYRRMHSRAISAVSSEVVSNSALGEAFRARVMTPILRDLRALIQAAVDRGQLPVDTDVVLLASLAPALLHEQLLLTGVLPDEAFVDRVVGQFFSGGRQ